MAHGTESPRKRAASSTCTPSTTSKTSSILESQPNKSIRQNRIEEYANSRNQENLLLILRTILPARWPQERAISSILEPLLCSAQKNGDMGPLIHAMQTQIPLTTYADYRSTIERMIQTADEDMMAPGRPSTFAVSGGTTSNVKKYLPLYTNFLSGESHGRRSERSRLWDYPQICFLGKRIAEHAIDGTPMAQATAFLPPPPKQVTPLNILYLEHYGDTLLLHALFGLGHPELQLFMSTYINILSDFFATVQRRALLLLESLETGVLIADEHLERPLSAAMRASLQEKLTANPTRAAELRPLLTGGGETAGLIKKIWPSLTLLAANCSGPYSNFLPAVKHLVGPTVPITSIAYGASEGVVAQVNGHHENEYIIGHPDIFFEFLEVPDPGVTVSSKEARVVQMGEVVLGQCYELVITTRNGLVRYRQGDVIRIVGWSAKAQKGYLAEDTIPPSGDSNSEAPMDIPTLEMVTTPVQAIQRHGLPVGPTMSFVGRSGQVLGLGGEVVRETDLTPAMANTGVAVREFAAFHDVTISPPRFGVYVELLEDPTPSTVTDATRKISDSFHAYLLREVALYEKNVGLGRLQGPPVTYVVQPGAFQHVRALKAAGGHVEGGSYAGFNQTKLPLAIHDPNLLAMLRERVFTA